MTSIVSPRGSSNEGMTTSFRMDTEPRFCKRWLAFALILPALSCGGGTKNPPATTTTPPPPPVVSVQLNQTSATISTAGTQQFTATVTGTSNTAVTWSVNSTAGGSSSVGTVSSSGLYTAPAQFGSYTVTATSVADTSKNASAAVTVLGSVAITPANAVIGSGATQQFTASVQGESTATYTWTVDGVSGGNATVGTITTGGLYTAPAVSGGHSIAATVTADSSATASTPVSIFTLSISPTTGTLIAPGATQQFTDTIAGQTTVPVTWSVDGIAGGNSTTGTISTTGLYTAPAALGQHNITVASVAYPTTSSTTSLTVINSSPGAILTYHNDDTRDGANTQEVTLTTANVNSTQFGKLLTYPVDGQIYPQPLYLPQVAIPNQGTHAVIYVATENNSVYAFDADTTVTTPTTFWHVNFGPPVPKFDSGGPWPNVGVLSTPVIDTTTNTMYVLAEVNGMTPPFWLHALDVTTGLDKVTAVGVTATYSGDTLSTSCYQRMGLSLNPVTNGIYIAFGSCDNGWILAYDKTTLAQTAAFEDTNGAQGGGLWASGGAPAIDDTTGDVYLMTGVDSGDQAWITGSTMVGFNDAFLRLDPNTLAVKDYFSPDDNYTLAVNDVDLGSGGVILVPGSTTYPHEVVGGGKDGNIFVVNRDSMGGFNDVTNNVLQTVLTGTQQYNNIFDTPVYWNGSIYYHCSHDVLRAFSWTAGADAGTQLSTQSTSAGANTYTMHGATPSLSANGTNNGIIWDIDNSTYVGDNPTTSGPSVLHAYDATNVATELYNSTQAGTRDTAGLALKFTVPTIANGRVYVPTATELDVYGLLP